MPEQLYDNLKKDLLDKINDLRKEHGSPSMKMSEDLCKDAANRATEHLKKGSAIAPFVKRGVSDVVFEIQSKEKPNMGLIMKHIENSEKLYDYKTGEADDKARIFTQIVWVNSKKIGFGFATQEDKWFLVLLFYPYGNVKGKYLDNVYVKGTSIKERGDDGPIPLLDMPSKEDLEKYLLKMHNKIRKRYGCDKFTWSNEMAQEAAIAAEKLAKAHVEKTNMVEYGKDYGKNIIYSESGIPSPTEAMKGWYNSHTLFSYDNYTINKENVSFVQMINKGAKKLGAGYGKKDGCVFCVVFYSPRLYITESIKDEIPKLISEKKVIFHEF